jgi:hypothetical protein
MAEKKKPRRISLALLRKFANGRPGVKKMSSFRVERDADGTPHANGFIDFYVARLAGKNVCLTSKAWRHETSEAALSVAREVQASAIRKLKHRTRRRA